MTITGLLENWYSQNGMYWGQVYFDRKGRFMDGESIHTSGVEDDPVTLPTGATVIKTRNSVYMLGLPRLTEDTPNE